MIDVSKIMITVYLYRQSNVRFIAKQNDQSCMQRNIFLFYIAAFFLLHRPFYIFCAVQDEHVSVRPTLSLCIRFIKILVPRLTSCLTAMSLLFDRAQATYIKCFEVNQIRIFFLDL